jgi:methionyl-tRNA formyltransferase
VSLRVAFLGTAEFAVPALKALKAQGFDIPLVVSQPDRPRGRGHQLKPTPLKAAALELGLKVFQPQRIREPEALERLAALKLDALAVVAYGQILPQALLSLPRLGAVNLHASLLPRWRGAAPIEWALAEGDAETGACTQRMALKLDAGDVLLTERCAIGDEDDAASLTERLASLGAPLLARTLLGLASGKLEPKPQDEAQATYARLLTRADGEADFSQPAAALCRRCRAFASRIGFHARTEGGLALKLHRVLPGPAAASQPGTLLAAGAQGLQVACGQGQSVLLARLQPEGGRSMDAGEFLRGHRLALGSRFQTPGA